jgi:riboflavin synthase
MTQRIGVVDTMFARVDMFPEVLRAFRDVGWNPEISRVTVPGFKDSAVEAKKLLESGCDIVITLSMAGRAPIDKQCAHEASTAFQQAMLMTSKHIVDVMVFEDESDDPRELELVARNRAYKHAINAYWLLNRPDELTRRAGTGERQGFENAGPLVLRAGRGFE